MRLFHLTTAANLRSILHEGLVPERSKASLPAVFLSGCRDTAEQYACAKDEPCVIVTVGIDPEEVRLGPDNYELRDALDGMTAEELAAHGLPTDARWWNCTWQQSLAICDQVACYSMIRPAQITWPAV